MIKKFFKSLEDPQMPLLAPNYWFMKKMGIILPDNKLKRFAYILLHEVVTGFVLSQFIELYFIKSDLNEVLTNLKISMLSSICVFKTNSAIMWQNRWRDVIKYVTESDKFERENRFSNSDTVIAKYTKYCRNVTFFYWALVFSTFMTVTQTPLMKYLSSSTFRENMRIGVEKFPHIFSSWMPIDKYHSPGCWITTAWHFVMCAYGGAIMACYDSCAMVIMVFFGGKLELMRARSSEMTGRAGQRLSDEEAAVLTKQLHQMHIELTKYSRMFNSLQSPVMFVYMILCSLMLCASAYQLSSAQSTTQKLLMAEYLVFGISQLFIFCWHSTLVVVKNNDLLLGPYESTWWDASLSQRRSVLILAGQFRIQHNFTAGPFTNLSLYTFIMILKGAYSYYTLLRD